MSNESKTAWMPSAEEIFFFPERAHLAALDAILQLTVQSLRAQYFELDLDHNGRLREDPDWEPFIPPQVPVIERIVGSVNDLRRLIVHYRCILEESQFQGSGVAPTGDDASPSDDTEST
ncbi:MAG TPA: hypothetical protein VLW83_16370 [Candidatus Acidoferrales bacterium]|nr:hypothetical protein [Candidatus Acidoferrales bacterium]